MDKKIPPEFSVGARVRVIAVTFPELPSHRRCLGKIGVVQKYETNVGAVTVLFDDGSVQVCFPENLELANP